MTFFTATWSLGYAALVVSVAISLYVVVYRRHRTSGAQAAQILLIVSALLLWANLLYRAIRGHGWPLGSPADLATGIAIVLLTLYIGWSTIARQRQAVWFISPIALVLLSYALIRQPPITLATELFPSPGARTETVLNLAGGALLALAAAASLSTLAARPSPPARRSDTDYNATDRASEAFVRIALFCLAMSLAIDTWWLQKVGLGNVNDAQQAGIAVSWMVYFVALRLRAQADWRGWPWTAVVSVGFFCTLPILLNVPWLEATLPL